MHKHPESPKAPIPVPKPPLKWTGCKARIINEIIARLPAGRRLIEPFVGGASVFLASNYEQYLLGDSNDHLIDLYTSIVHRFDDLLALALPNEQTLLLFRRFLPVIYLLQDEVRVVEYEWNPVAYGRSVLEKARAFDSSWDDCVGSTQVSSDRSIPHPGRMLISEIRPMPTGSAVDL